MAGLASERVERRLTAILAADVAGYSRLMGADEEGTLAQLKAHRRELVDPKIAEHRGRIVKTTGDGLLAEFASVVDAVRCAVEFQREMAGRNAGVAARPAYRIPRRDQSRRYHQRRGRHFRRRRQRRGPARSPGRAWRDLRQPRRARPGARQARPRVRGFGRTTGQEHRAAGAGLPGWSAGVSPAWRPGRRGPTDARGRTLSPKTGAALGAR